MSIKRKKIENTEESPFLRPESDSDEPADVSDILEEKKRAEESETVAEERSEEKYVSRKKRRRYWEFGFLLGVIIFILAVIGVLVFLTLGKINIANNGKVSIHDIPEDLTMPKESASSQTSSSAPVAQNTTPVSQSVSPLDTAIKILNGGAVGGSAGKMKELLAGKGYKKLEASNSNSAYSGTTIFYRSEAKTVAEKILTDIKSKYPFAQIKLGASSEEKSGPIVIILGK